MMKQTKKQDIKRNTVWILLLSACFLLQTTFGFAPHLGTVKLLPLLPFLAGICMFEKEKSACWYGLGAGLLMDMVSPSMVGYHALILLIICTFIGWLSTNYLRNTLLTNLLCGALLIFLSQSLYWLFFIEFKQTAGAAGVYFTDFLPTIVVNTLLIFPVFFIIRAINSRLKSE